MYLRTMQKNPLSSHIILDRGEMASHTSMRVINRQSYNTKCTVLGTRICGKSQQVKTKQTKIYARHKFVLKRKNDQRAPPPWPQQMYVIRTHTHTEHIRSTCVLVYSRQSDVGRPSRPSPSHHRPGALFCSTRAYYTRSFTKQHRTPTVVPSMNECGPALDIWVRGTVCKGVIDSRQSKYA